LGLDSGRLTDSQGTAQDTALQPASVTGRAVGLDGAPIEGLRVTLCRGACQYDDTKADGSFYIPLVRPELYPVHFADFTGELGLAHPLYLVDLPPGEDVVLPEDMIVPSLADPVPLPESPGEVALLPGFYLDLVPEDLWLAPWEPEGHLQAALAPDISALVPFEGAIAVWYLAPFKSLAYSDISLRIANAWDLAPGAQVRAWVCSYDMAEWSDGGLLTVGADGAWLTGGAIRELTTLVLVPEVP
jgi:hypothetical protein